jgi:hypothetical protein
MYVCCECCVLSGRGLCDELITCPEKSYRLWCVVVCDLEKRISWMRRPRPTRGLSRQERKKERKKTALDYNELYSFFNNQDVYQTKFSVLTLLKLSPFQIIILALFICSWSADIQFQFSSCKKKKTGDYHFSRFFWLLFVPCLPEILVSQMHVANLQTYIYTYISARSF